MRAARCLTLAAVWFADQVIVGSLNGTLTIVDPGRDIDNRAAVAVLVEKRVGSPILQTLVGRFLSSYDAPLIAVLHPSTLAFYRLSTCERDGRL